MTKSLVVVESPAKAKTIERYLGADFQVIASMGHVRDLPKSDLGVDVENDFQPKYVVTRGRGNVLKRLRDASKKAPSVYLATDLDREGEAIAWHLAETLNLDPEATYRVVFNEITASAIRAAFAQPGRLDMDKVNAQQARRILDRLVGYKLSPLLWRKIRRGLSAGRVQSVAVRLVVEREREIEAFKAEEYWRIRAQLAPQGVADEAQQFTAELHAYDGHKFRPALGEDAQAIADELRGADYTVTDRQTKRRKDKAPPPFITSQLQQTASTRLRFTGRRTMRIAQDLYEGVELGGRGSVALITYMRTDSYHVAESALKACREFIAAELGPQYVPEKAHYFSSRDSAQQAHEAIRPTDVALTPNAVKQFLAPDHFRLYELIWTRFVASQMKPAEWEVTNLSIAAGKGDFRAIGRTLVYDGHTRLTGLRLAENEQILPPVAKGQRLDLVELVPSQHFTQPPPRYTEATLIKKLESLGIGRPSTYASILATIEDRGYVEQESRRFHATELGKVVTDKLVEHFPNILNVDFTRHMEEDLDKIETGEMGHLDVLREFYEPFSQALDAALESMKRPEPKDTGRKCPECGGKLLERMGRFGMFVGCENYPECKFIEKPKKEPPKGETTDLPCLKCRSPLIRVKSRRGTVYYACSDAAGCGAMFPARAESAEPYQPDPCSECSEPMVVRLSRGEPFLGCSAYPKCRNTVSLGPKRGKGGAGGRGRGGGRKKVLETDIACDKCGKKMVVRMNRRGPFLACPGYPKCKNAKDAPPELIEKFNAMNAETGGDDTAATDGGDDRSAPTRKPPARTPQPDKESGQP